MQKIECIELEYDIYPPHSAAHTRVGVQAGSDK
jgi:hypothetical protein